LIYPSAQGGKQRSASVTQDHAGAVIRFQLQQCDTRELAKVVQLAVLEASPLPLSVDKRLFERNLVLVFMVPKSD
jgi:hypothetical protein